MASAVCVSNIEAIISKDISLLSIKAKYALNVRIKDKINVRIIVYFVLAKILRINRNETTWTNIGILGANLIGRNAINPI